MSVAWPWRHSTMNISSAALLSFPNHVWFQPVLLDVGKTTYPRTSWRLVNHDAGIGQWMPHPYCSRCQEQAAHACCLANAPGRDWIKNVLHGVVNGQASCHHTSCTGREWMNWWFILGLFYQNLKENERVKALFTTSTRYKVHNTILQLWSPRWWPLPGLLMYMWMGLLLLSDCRKSSWAITRLATESSIWTDKWEKKTTNKIEVYS